MSVGKITQSGPKLLSGENVVQWNLWLESGTWRGEEVDNQKEEEEEEEVYKELAEEELEEEGE